MKARPKRRPPLRGLRERFESEWAVLEQLLSRAEVVGLAGLSVVEVRNVVRLYRRVVSSVALAREQAVDPPLVEYLERLTARAHVALHGTTRPTRPSLRRFVGLEIPRAVRRIAAELAASTVAVALGIILGAVLTAKDPAWFFAFVDDALALVISPAEQTSVLAAALDPTLTAALWSRAVWLALFALALGVAGGGPGLIALFCSGTMAGALAALMVGRGLGEQLVTWLAPHAAATGLAFLLFGAVGLSLGRALVRPRRVPMPVSLRSAARNGAVVVVGATALLVVGLLSRTLVGACDASAWVRVLIGWGHIVWISLWLFPLSPKGRG